MNLKSWVVAVVLFVALAALSFQSSSANMSENAPLVSCTIGTNIAGIRVYVGLYQTSDGRLISKEFQFPCPRTYFVSS